MTLHVHHGSRLADLADTLVGLLADPLDDPFETEVVAVPTAGVREFLIRRIAAATGVAANIDWSFPGRFVARALTAAADDRADDDDIDPWAIDELVWAVLAELRHGSVEVPGIVAAEARHTQARRIADLYDHYAVNRPELLQAWASGAVTDAIPDDADDALTDDEGHAARLAALRPSLQWQQRLWTAVDHRLGGGNPAVTQPAQLAALAAGTLVPALPRRVAWVGMSAIPRARLAVLRALAEQRDVHLLVLHPSPVGWSATAPVGSGLQPRRAFAGTAAAAHPLARSWGAPAIEMAALVNGLGAAVHQHSVGESPPSVAPTLLAQLQADIAADRPPTRVSSDVAVDQSIEVHATHGPLRQLEVLRDALARRFVADPTLRPEDVVILAADVSRFAPFAEAVFGRGALPIPLTVSDLSLGAVTPVAEAFHELVAVARGRATATEVLGLLSRDPVRRRLGFSADDIDRIAGWISDLGAAWGVDADHRREWLGEAAPPIEAGSWRASLAALLTGAAIAAPQARRVLGGVVPYDDLDTAGAELAGRLADALARLDSARAAFSGVRTVREWCDALSEHVELFCATEPADGWQLQAVLAGIEAVAEAAQRADPDLTVHADDLPALAAAAVRAGRGRLRLRTGRALLTGLVPMRNVPARIVALVGFDEESLRMGAVDGDNLLNLRPSVGEPDRRAERRQALLDAVLAAGEALLITWQSRDPVTNRERAQAVALGELLGVVAEMTRSDHEAEPRSTVIVTHPMRAQDPANFRAGGPGGEAPFGFDPAMLQVARAHVAAGDGVRPDRITDWAVPATASSIVTFDELERSMSRPHHTLLRRGLDLRLPPGVESVDVGIPLAVSKLEASQLGRELLAELRLAAAGWLAAGDEPTGAEFRSRVQHVADDWRQRAALGHGLPPGTLAAATLQQVVDEVGILVDAVVTATEGKKAVLPLSAAWFLAAADTMAVDLQVTVAPISGGDPEAVTVRGVLTNVGVGPDGAHWLTAVKFSRPHNRTRLGLAVRLACAMIAAPEYEWRGALLERPGDSKTLTAKLEHFAPPRGAAGREAALAVVEAAVAIHLDAQRRRLALFEDASKEVATGSGLDDELLWGNPAIGHFGDLDDAEARFVWGDITITELLAERPSPGELAAAVWGPVDRLLENGAPS